MSVHPEVRIVGERALVRQGGQTLAEVPLEHLMQSFSGASRRPPSCGYLPEGVRLWDERGDSVGLVLEIPPDARSVRWLQKGSRVPFGRGAKYHRAYLSFPYCVVLLVFRNGSLTGQQQLYYRTRPLGGEDRLLLPNLFNVASGYEQTCWVCLANMKDVRALSWSKKIEAVRLHLFSAAFNESSEMHEGNSYWTSGAAVDPRLASVEAWEKATRQDPFFALGVRWKPARTTARAELREMLDRVAAPRNIRSATDLAGAVTAVAAQKARA